MSALLVFTVEGPPVPWARTATYQGHRITPKRQRTYQDLVGYTAQEALSRPRPVWPVLGAFAVELDVYCQDKRRRDLDNFAKTVGDACNGIVWADDSQIVEWRARRFVDKERPRIEVRVRVVEEQAA